MFIALIIFVAIVGFIAWIITRPNVPIESPFKEIIIGLLVLVVLLACLGALRITSFGILDFIPLAHK